MRSLAVLLVAFFGCVSAVDFDCRQVPIIQCCASAILRRCAEECSPYAAVNCPERLKPKDNAVKDGNSRNASVKSEGSAEPAEPVISRHSGEIGGIKAHAAPINSKAVIEIRTGDRNDEPTNCGSEENDFAPCTDTPIANEVFRSCCEQYVGEECHDLCQYETADLAARQLMVRVVKDNKCSLRNLSPILFCASQNRDNRACCQHLDLASDKLSVGDRCLRMCDPAGQKIDVVTKEDLVCLGNWNVIMYCHQSGLRV